MALKFKVVKTNKELDTVIAFLGTEFNWKYSKIIKIKSRLIEANKSIGFYGFILQGEDGCLNGAILAINQAELKKKTIINLMSIYVSPEYRGLNTFLFLENILKELNPIKYIITGYSASDNADLIFQQAGFSTMNCGYTTWNIAKDWINTFNNIYLILSKNIGIKYISKERVRISEISFNCISTIYKIESNKKDCLFIGIKNHVSKELLGIKINIPIYYILWAEDEDFIFKNWYAICFSIMVRMGTLLICTNTRKTDSRDLKLLNHNRYHIYSKNNNIKYIPPIGSEISI